MKTSTANRLLLAASVLAFSAGAGHAQNLSTSTGAFGPLTLADNETRVINLPADGRINATTIALGTGSKLSFVRNFANTPVYLLATGAVSIKGTVDVSGYDSTNSSTPGLGGPGGYDGGRGTTASGANGWGLGPGGGKPGQWLELEPAFQLSGVFSADQGTNTAKYGNSLLIPLIGGSGGGGGSGAGQAGAGGGGAVLLASDVSILVDATTTTTAGLYAMGGLADHPSTGKNGGPGSGGGIRLLAPTISFSGNPWLRAFTRYQNSGRQPDRIRLDGLELTGVMGRLAQVVPPASIGRNMIAFPATLPKIEIISAAGQTVDPAASTTVTVPPGGAAQQPVVVRVTNFGGAAQLKVVLTPESGARVEADLDITNPGPGATTGTANLAFPANQVSRIDVWTR